jgi:hypothetical protein
MCSGTLHQLLLIGRVEWSAQKRVARMEKQGHSHEILV